MRKWLRMFNYPVPGLTICGFSGFDVAVLPWTTRLDEESSHSKNLQSFPDSDFIGVFDTPLFDSVMTVSAPWGRPTFLYYVDVRTRCLENNVKTAELCRCNVFDSHLEDMHHHLPGRCGCEGNCSGDINAASSSLHWDAAHDVVIARNLAEGNGFVNEPGQPTAYRYPLHPFVLSLVFRVIGERYVAVCLLQALMGALVCSGTAWLGYRIGGGALAWWQAC